MMEDRTSSHYERLAEDYNDNWVYNPGFIEWMTRHILDRLNIRPGDRSADIGCGTGLYSKALAERTSQVLCIDPSAGMLEQLPESPALTPVQASAEAVVSGEVALPYDRFDAILVKEAIHHVGDRFRTLDGLARMLAPGGRLLVVMLPTRIDYPLFSAALELFEQLQPDPHDVATAMRVSGLHVDMQYESFALSFDKARYIGMVRSRYMSLLSSFDDAKLEQGIAEMNSRYLGDRLDFVDRHAFILGTGQ
jgi:2-polyprenyl-3-methyl-5-hydroxy-6-metoxy-1,4-benzoquinol methylase